jgi:hypothetical protein
VLQQIYQICTSHAGLVWLVMASDLLIASAYFAIPITMAVVLRHRADDIPYPWLWILFVTFIVACGLTHVVHLFGALTGSEHLATQVLIGAFTAVVSVGTAVAFALALPQIKNLPSPKRQKEFLEQAVAVRTAEKDKLLREINHRIGNQLQILSSLLRIERRKAQNADTIATLERISVELERLNARHLDYSTSDYLGSVVRNLESPCDERFTPRSELSSLT